MAIQKQNKIMTIKYHFFGTEIEIDRELSNRGILNDGLAKEGFGDNRSLFLNQIHSNKVCIIDSVEKIHGDQNLPKADAIVTNLADINIGVVTADCAPVLFFCEESNVTAAAHAGWKGAKLGVIQNTIMAMQELGASNIRSVIGTMISQESYEVSKEFYDEFISDDLANKVYFIAGKSTDKFLFDLNKYVEDRLRKSGVQNIKNLKTDTYQSEGKYFSYRRTTHKNEEDCGRNVSLINASR